MWLERIRKMWKRVLLVCVVSLVVRLDTEASTIRSSFVENINSGLKMLGKNDRRLHVSHHSYYSQLPAGISNNIADLVSQSFAPVKNNGKRSNIRQDSVVIGPETPLSSDNTFIGGMLQLLGFDSSKIGAAAINGIIFIAQMVRYSASKAMDYMMTKTWDWYRIVDYISERVRNETNNATASRIRFKANNLVL